MMFVHLVMGLLMTFVAYRALARPPYSHLSVSINMLAAIVWFGMLVADLSGKQASYAFMLGVAVGIYATLVVRDIAQHRYLANSEPRWYFGAHVAGLFIWWYFLTSILANG